MGSHNKYLREYLINELEHLLPHADQNDYEMYGNDYYGGLGHLIDNFLGNSPDEIGKRPELYYYYVDKLIDLLKAKYPVATFDKSLIIKDIKSIITIAKETECSRLDAIMSFECALHSNPSVKEIDFNLPYISDNQWNSIVNYVNKSRNSMNIRYLYRTGNIGTIILK